MKLLGVMDGDGDAERLWREEGACIIAMDFPLRRAAIELYGLSDAEAFGGADCRVERHGATVADLVARIEAAVGRGVVRQRIADLLDVARHSEGVAVLTGLRDEDRDWLAGMGGTLL